jgi:hypothetical protein
MQNAKFKIQKNLEWARWKVKRQECVVAESALSMYSSPELRAGLKVDAPTPLYLPFGSNPTTFPLSHLTIHFPTFSASLREICMLPPRETAYASCLAALQKAAPLHETFSQASDARSAPLPLAPY